MVFLQGVGRGIEEFRGVQWQCRIEGFSCLAGTCYTSCNYYFCIDLGPPKDGFKGLVVDFLASHYFISPLRVNGSGIEIIFEQLKHTI